MKLRRFWVIVALALGLLWAPLAADAQQAGKVFRIGTLGTVPLTDPEVARIWGAFFLGLRELGYVEGQNITIERRFSEGRAERFPQLATELVQLKVEVIVVTVTPAALAAKKATRTIPIVMLGTGDPVANGLVASLARPGGNITGLSLLAAELGGKRLQLLKEVLPRLSGVAVLWNVANPYTILEVRETEIAARALGIQIQSLGIREADEFESAFREAATGRAGALIVVGDGLTIFHRARIVELAARHQLPAMYGFREFVDTGGLMGYGANLPDMYRRGATYVDKILKGAKPGDLPIQQPTKFELVVNLKTAKALGLTIPQSIFIRADEVIPP